MNEPIAKLKIKGTNFCIPIFSQTITSKNDIKMTTILGLRSQLGEKYKVSGMDVLRILNGEPYSNTELGFEKVNAIKADYKKLSKQYEACITRAKKNREKLLSPGFLKRRDTVVAQVAKELNLSQSYVRATIKGRFRLTRFDGVIMIDKILRTALKFKKQK